jgi:hypothetical protein
MVRCYQAARGDMGSIFTLVVSVKTASPFVCIPNWPQQKLIAAEGSVRSGHGIVRSESPAGVAQAGQGACEMTPKIPRHSPTVHGTLCGTLYPLGHHFAHCDTSAVKSRLCIFNNFHTVKDIQKRGTCLP